MPDEPSPPTVTEVAAAAGVSAATVSRVLTGRALRSAAEPPRITPPAWSFNVFANFGRVDCSAGSSPNIAPASSEIANVNPRTVQSGVLDSESGVRPVGRNPISARSMATASPIPPGPPTAASIRLSINS